MPYLVDALFSHTSVLFSLSLLMVHLQSQQ